MGFSKRPEAVTRKLATDDSVTLAQRLAQNLTVEYFLVNLLCDQPFKFTLYRRALRLLFPHCYQAINMRLADVYTIIVTGRNIIVFT